MMALPGTGHMLIHKFSISTLRCGCVAAALLLAGSGLFPQAAFAYEDEAESAEARAEVTENDPMTLVVSLSKQRIELYRGTTHLASSNVSSGRPGYSTPSGIFSILDKRRHHRSNIYSRAPMPFMQRLTWSGIALHSSNSVPNRPASHGCVRLPDSFARELFSTTERGIHVVVARGETEPAPISHDNLFQPPSLVGRTASASGDAPMPAGSADVARTTGAPLSYDFEAELPGPQEYELRSSSPLRILITRRTGREQVIDTQRLLIELGYEPGEVDGYMGPNTGNAIIAFQKDHELRETGAFSEELLATLHRFAGKGEVPTGHIYVRQDYIDIFDAPITFSDAAEPLGTHMYTLMDFVHDGTDARWTGITVEPAEGTDMVRALDRASIPADISARIANMLTPGSSIAISDHGISIETGRGTDFIVLTER